MYDEFDPLDINVKDLSRDLMRIAVITECFDAEDWVRVLRLISEIYKEKF